LARFGFNFGMAFQIRDDLNDFLIKQQITGKPFGKDITEGVITLPFILAIKENSHIQMIFNEAFAAKRKITQTEMKEIVNLIKQTNALEKTQQILNKYIEKANVHLCKLPENKYKPLFAELVNKLKLTL